jgi:hypothetical protein
MKLSSVKSLLTFKASDKLKQNDPSIQQVELTLPKKTKKYYFDRVEEANGEASMNAAHLEQLFNMKEYLSKGLGFQGFDWNRRKLDSLDWIYWL